MLTRYKTTDTWKNTHISILFSRKKWFEWLLFKLNDDLTLADVSNVRDSNETMFFVTVSNIVTDQANFYSHLFFFLLLALQNWPQPPVGDLEQCHFGVTSSMRKHWQLHCTDIKAEVTSGTQEMSRHYHATFHWITVHIYVWLLME